MAAVCKRYLQKAHIVFCSLDVLHVWGKRGRQVSGLTNTDEIHRIEAMIKYSSNYVNQIMCMCWCSKQQIKTISS